jgi:phytoene synthase
MTVSDQDLEALVRRVDPDRWLAARFVSDARARAEVIALYALNHELARVAESVSNPLIGEIRLAWWREGVEALAAGEPAPGHPVLQALAPAVAEGRAPLDLVLALVETRALDLEPEPFADEAALVAYIDGTAGALMAAAAHMLDAAAPAGATLGAARAWGWAGLYRAGPAWAARGRRWAPAAWADAEESEIALHVAHRVEAALKAAGEEVRSLPVAAFPAVAYAALARPYLQHGRLTELGRQARLLAAVARGRV